MPAAFDDDSLAGLRDGLRGTAIVDGDEVYDEARTVFNAMIDRRPAVIVQCEEPSDVVRALAFARERGLEVAVRGGGHSVAGMALTDGGVVIDLRRMNAVQVDPDAMTAVVGGGATMSHLDRACERPVDGHLRWANSTNPTDSPPPGAESRLRVSGVSPSAAEPAGWTASSGWRATTCWPLR